MFITDIKIKNFKILKDIELHNIQDLCVLIGDTASGKKTLFEVLIFLKKLVHYSIEDAFKNICCLNTIKIENSTSTLHKHFFNKVNENIIINLKVKKYYDKKISKKNPEFEYYICIGYKQNNFYVKKEYLKSSLEKKDIFNLTNGKGFTINGKINLVFNDLSGLQLLKDEKLNKKSNYLLNFFGDMIYYDPDIRLLRLGENNISINNNDPNIYFKQEIYPNGVNLLKYLIYLKKWKPIQFKKIKSLFNEYYGNVNILKFELLSDSMLKHLYILISNLVNNYKKSSFKVINNLQNDFNPTTHRNILNKVWDEKSQVFVICKSYDMANEMPINFFHYFSKYKNKVTVYNLSEDKETIGLSKSDGWGYVGEYWESGSYKYLNK